MLSDAWCGMKDSRGDTNEQKDYRTVDTLQCREDVEADHVLQTIAMCSLQPCIAQVSAGCAGNEGKLQGDSNTFFIEDVGCVTLRVQTVQSAKG